MKFPRCIRLDQSDVNVFASAAEPGEWAVPGAFAFADRDTAGLVGGEKVAFHTGWLGTDSFGRSTLVEVAEIDEADFFAVIERLARHFVEAYGAPSLTEALPVAREEADYAAELCDRPLGSLLSLERETTAEGMVERYRVVRHARAADHARIWEIVPDDPASD